MTTTTPLTDAQLAQLAELAAGWKRVVLYQWQAEGYDVAQYADFMRAPRAKATKTCQRSRPVVSKIGDRVKRKTGWTGIWGCGLCAATADEMNRCTVDEVRERLEELAKRMCDNVIAMAEGRSPKSGLSWLQQQYNRIAAKGALAITGPAGVLDLCRSYIREACAEEEQTPACSAGLGPAESAGSTGSSSAEPPKSLPRPTPPSADSGTRSASEQQERPTPPSPPQAPAPPSAEEKDVS